MYGNQPKEQAVRSGRVPPQSLWHHNKPYLDDEEKVADLDSEDYEYLDTDRVYNILAELRQEQRNSLNLKKIIYALSVFALLLALANIGTSFAGARSAKDTKVNSNGDIEDKATGLRVGVTDKTTVYEVKHVTGRRNLQPGVAYSEHEITKTMADTMYKELCYGWPGLDNYDGSTLSCGGGAASVDLHSCGFTTKVTRKSMDPISVGSNLVFAYNAYRGDFGYGDVTITCDMSSIDATCHVSGLKCQQECRLCGNSRPWHHWFCAAEDQCSECTVGGCVTPGDGGEFCDYGCKDPDQEFVS